jgi:hypothetical protein
MHKPEWTAEDRFTVNGVNFRSVDVSNFYGALSTVDEFILFKPRRLILRLQALLKRLEPRNVLELGIWQGGSAVFIERCTGARVVTLDLMKTRLKALDEHIERHALTERLRPWYGVNQANSPVLRRIVRKEFAGQPLDLVIDDASHLLDETRSSFNTLFPQLRPGGAYVIEHWAWAHVQVGGAPRRGTGPVPRQGADVPAGAGAGARECLDQRDDPVDRDRWTGGDRVARTRAHQGTRLRHRALLRGARAGDARGRARLRLSPAGGAAPRTYTPRACPTRSSTSTAAARSTCRRRSGASSSRPYTSRSSSPARGCRPRASSRSNSAWRATRWCWLANNWSTRDC